jgi:pimeloyl-[acyl-carrier protein] methyl ester esterase
LVLLHGWAMHGGIFAPLVQALRGHRTLHVVDLPGHGHNRDCGVPLTLDACANALFDAVPDAPWCGWSLGGLIALHAASTQPRRIPALAMICATPKFVVADDWPLGMPAECSAASPKAARDWRTWIASSRWRLRLRSHARRTAHVARCWAHGEPATHVLAEGLQVLEDSDLREALPALRMPSLWIGGRRDRLVNPQAMQASAALAPESRYVQVEHAGHAPFLTHAMKLRTRSASSGHRMSAPCSTPSRCAGRSRVPPPVMTRPRDCSTRWKRACWNRWTTWTIPR